MKPKTAIFVAYHKKSPLFASSIYLPLHVGAALSQVRLDMTGDDSGDSISSKNPFYCELTGLYWVWKNYLPDHPDVDRIGFCHYRRFLDPFHPARQNKPFRPETFLRFSAIFAKWDSAEVDKACHAADVLLPEKTNLRQSLLYDRKRETVYSQLARGGHAVELDALLETLSHHGMAQEEAIRKVFLGFSFHSCLTFVMKREQFTAFAQWMFSLLEELEKDSRELVRSRFLSARTPGFLAERLLDVWLENQPGILVRECDSLLLSDSPPTSWFRIRQRLRRIKHPPANARSFPLPPTLC